jgi:Fe-S oxidoreductase
MLPLDQRIGFLISTALLGALGARGFYRLYLRMRRGRADTEERRDRPLRRLAYAFLTAFTQRRTFRGRPVISFFHAFIFYGFVFYLLVNLIDGVEGYFPFTIPSSNPAGALYNLCADLLSFLVLLGVIALVVRRFLVPSRRDFDFNPKTLIDRKTPRKVTRDSVIVSVFILFHVGSRAIGQAARLKLAGMDRFQPFAGLLSHLVPPAHAEALRLFGYWGALGSVLLFLAYFPWTKHVHIFMAPLKYFFARTANSGRLPAMDLELDPPPDGSESEAREIGAGKLEDMAWPRLLDAFACIQCNRCQDACPATATGKSLSPSALEINKRMELNRLGAGGGLLAIQSSAFEKGVSSPRPLLAFALSPEALWACTTCGACMEVCPVQDEPMLDIIDIRRNQVMMKGEFPNPLQTAFRGMERARNPWGIGRDQRMAWAEGLAVKTVEENPNADVLYWVGCAASYDPQAQRTARALVQLLNLAKVNFAVLGKHESCTGDSARRAGNEYLYTQLAGENIRTLNRVNPKLIVATCPHCMNTIGNEYSQLGGNYLVVHHTELLRKLVADGRLEAAAAPGAVAYHDPCYLGRHNGVYDSPRDVLRGLTGEFVELERSREKSFCCGAGGAQFWKEEEPGSERISDNRYREAERSLASASGPKVLAVACPFCKSMLESTPGKGTDIAVKDVAELLLEGVERKSGKVIHQESRSAPPSIVTPQSLPSQVLPIPRPVEAAPAPAAPDEAPRAIEAAPPEPEAVAGSVAPPASQPARKTWQPKRPASPTPPEPEAPAPRKPWKPNSK